MRSFIAAMLIPALMSNVSYASSHREAPGIATDGQADITDIYMFKAGGDRAASHVVLVMNVYPGLLPNGAPNWYTFAEDTRYEFNIDNTGDAIADVTYRWEFKTQALDGDGAKAPLAYLPGLQFANGRYQYNLSQNYSLTKVTASGEQVISPSAPVAPARVGPFTTDYANPAKPIDFASATKTDPKLADQRYAALTGPAQVTAGAYRMFAGPRNDPFYVDLGGVFDGLNIRVPGLSGTPVDALKGLNVLSIVVEVPVSDLVRQGSKPIFAGWATTSRKQTTFRRVGEGNAINSGGFVQVARLANPLVNEVVIGFKDKDKFNATTPATDAANFAGYVVNPTLAALIQQFYGKGDGKTIPAGIVAPLLENFTTTNRTDLVDAFVLGIEGVNKIPGATGSGDMMRMNLDLPDGWPVSGRKLTDNVVLSALTFIAECRFLPDYGNFDVGGVWKNHTKGLDTINCKLSDGLSADDKTLGGSGITTAFPYVGLPHSSYGVRGNL